MFRCYPFLKRGHHLFEPLATAWFELPRAGVTNWPSRCPLACRSIRAKMRIPDPRSWNRSWNNRIQQNRTAKRSQRRSRRHDWRKRRREEFQHGGDGNAPPLVDDLPFMANDTGAATCLKAASGMRARRVRLRGHYAASLLYADERACCFGLEGKTTVRMAARECERIATSVLESGSMVSPAA